MSEQTTINIYFVLDVDHKPLKFDGPTVPKLSTVLCKLGFMILMDPETLMILRDTSAPVPNGVLLAFEWSATTIRLYKDVFMAQREIIYPAMEAECRNEADRQNLAELKETFGKMIE